MEVAVPNPIPISSEQSPAHLLVDFDKLIEIEASSEALAGTYGKFLSRARFGFDKDEDWAEFYREFSENTMQPAFLNRSGWVRASFLRFLRGTREEMKRDLIEGYEDIPEMILTVQRIRYHYKSVHRWLHPYKGVPRMHEYLYTYREALHGIYSYGHQNRGSSYPAWIHGVLREMCDRGYAKLKDIPLVPLNILLITFASTLKIFFERVRQNKCTRKGWAIHAKVLGKLHWVWNDSDTDSNSNSGERIAAAKLAQEGVGTQVGVKEKIIGIIKDEEDDRVAFLEVMELVGETLREE